MATQREALHAPVSHSSRWKGEGLQLECMLLFSLRGENANLPHFAWQMTWMQHNSGLFSAVTVLCSTDIPQLGRL